ncbi:MAG: hypothetical protein H7Z21_19870 [Hymenobacter sp.]|nr:hypothetical protein [Hymenobacter sp.]
MARQVTATITCAGAQLAPGIDFHQVALTQTLFDHHALTLVVPFDSIEGPTTAFFSQAPQRLLGQAVSVEVRADDAPHSNEAPQQWRFKGIITDLGTSKGSDYVGSITIQAYSPCYLLNDGRQKRAFVNQTLAAIFRQVLAPYPANLLPHRLQPVHQAPLPYVVQYDESNYAFLSRLASEYAEWFYYDGQTLQLGPPQGGQEINFVADGDHNSFHFGLSLRPTKATLYDYNYLRHEHFTADTSRQQLPAISQHPYGQLALAQSEKLFAEPARVSSDTFIEGTSQLHEEAQALKAHSVTSLVTLQGHSANPSLQLGGIISVSGEGLGSRHITADSFGKYRLIELTHSVDASGNYHNAFTAIPHLLDVPPLHPHHAPPTGTPELAEVIDAKDPKKLGRLRVRYHWHVHKPQDAETGWLRVLTPYSGNGKGQLFNPEVGSQVLVGYESSLAEQPLVLGNLFHANNQQKASYSPASNGMKGIQTAGGNKVVMLDKQGEQKILISNSNQKGTAITMSFQGDGSVHIQSSGPVTVNGSVITLDAGAPGKGQTAFTGEIKMRAKTITLEAEEELTATSKKKSITLKAKQNVAIDATEKMEVKAKEKTITTTQKLTVSGGSQVDIKAGKVKINS